jgi:hypothetical protein
MINEFGVSHAGESAPLSKLKQRRSPNVVALRPGIRSRARLKKQPSVDELQRWVQEVTTHIGGVDAGIASPGAQALIAIKPQQLDQVVLPSKNLSSHERIGIYADMYYLRLVECLGKDFTALKYAFGEERFDEIAKQFVSAHPSRSFSLNVFGAKMPQFLEKEVADLPNREFLVEVARLEWTIQEVFEGKNVEPLTAAQLEKISPSKWAKARVELIPAFRLLKFDFPVNNFVQAVYNEKDPGLPEPRTNWLRVYRRGYRVWRARIDEHQYNLLSAIASGMTLTAALDECIGLAGRAEKRVAAQVGDWFKEWAADGLFAAVKY